MFHVSDVAKKKQKPSKEKNKTKKTKTKQGSDFLLQNISKAKAV